MLAMIRLVTAGCTVVVLGAALGAQAPAPPPPDTAAKPAAGAPAADASRPRLPPDLGPDYRLSVGDKLRIEVYKDAQVSQSVVVRPDGKITLPLANDIVAAGRTPTELRDAVAEALKGYIVNPTVTVIVVESVLPVVYVMGEVNRSGAQSLVGRMDLLQALSAAGGFRDFANTKNIRVRRRDKIMTVNYNDVVKGKAATLYLQPGDTIIVP